MKATFGIPMRQVVDIHDLAYGGEGVARTVDGRVAFVPFTIPGERVEIDVVEERKTFLRCQLCEILVPATNRVPPVCPFFGCCGGCQYQHIDYAAQIAYKVKQLVDLLTRMGKFDPLPEVSPTIVSPVAYNYRNKLTLEAFTNDSGEPDYGFFGHAESRFVAVKTCPLAAPEINQLLPTARDLGQATDGVGGGRLVLRKPVHGKARFYLGQPHPRMDWLIEEACGLKVRVPLASFWQVHPAVGDALGKLVAQWGCELACANLVDAYAGVGVFSLAIGKSCRHGSLIETDRDALAVAQWNHRHFGITGREFLAGRSERLLPRLLARLGGLAADTLVILDPPRSGCVKDVSLALSQRPVKAIVYVSCNPATMARDLKTLCAQGVYRLARLAVADMFPQTAHFESVALLTARRTSSVARRTRREDEGVIAAAD